MRAEERTPPVGETKVNFSPFSQLRTLTTRAPRALTFSVKVDSTPGVRRWPSSITGISMGMRFSARKNVYVDFGGMAGRSSSQKPRNAARNFAPSPATFHAVTRAARDSKKLFE